MNSDTTGYVTHRFEIGEPLKSLFKMSFRVDPGEIVKVHLLATVPDSYGTGPRNIAVSRYLHSNEAKDEVYFAVFMRALIRETLQHEADESLLMDGKRIFDPHKVHK